MAILHVFNFKKHGDWVEVTVVLFLFQKVATRKTLDRLLRYLKVLKEKLTLFKMKVLIFVYILTSLTKSLKF